MLPREYTRVEWIESTGSQYIDTGFKPNQDTRVVMDVEVVRLSGYAPLFGARKATKSYDFSTWVIDETRAQDGYGSNYDSNITVNLLGRHTIDKNKNRYIVDGSTLFTHTQYTFQTAYPIFIFNINTAGNTTGTYTTFARVYSCQIYDNGTLIRDYIPCIDANGVANLWDDVNKTLATKVGTFTAGPAIPAPSAPASLRTALAVRLLWDPVSAADYYNIYRDGELIGTTTDAQYIDTTAAENATYTYGISAANGGGESAQTQITVYTRTGYFLYKPYITTANFP